ncbi:variable surface lipoprotein [Mycoplasmopsis bovis]|uniref:variable surface lipoprotein n=1 Tax=Mycoplasmopsis bovis TaxID=28903 RepID=UPI003D2C90C2
MKKSKFLLLGSVASLASIPFVAAKCGETKEEKKLEADKPDQSTPANPGQGTPTNPDQGTPANPDQGTPTNPDQGTPANPGQGTPTNPDQGTPANPDQGTPTNPGQGTPAKPHFSPEEENAEKLIREALMRRSKKQQ